MFPHHIETSQLICNANQLTGFHIMGNIWSLMIKISISISKIKLIQKQPSRGALRKRCSEHCMKIRIFVLRKFVKRTEKIIFSLVFVCFRFTEISYFLNFPSNENVRKQHLSANVYSCVNMKFSYTIAVRKDEIFYVVLLRKQAIFHLRLGQLFVDDI